VIRIWRASFWLALAGIAVLSLLPGEFLVVPLFDWWDKAQHAVAFATLAVLGRGAYPGNARLLAVGLLGFGGAIEVLQQATGWRYGDVLDFVADAVGIMAGLAIGAGVLRVRAASMTG
jgi:hypothetical protein